MFPCHQSAWLIKPGVVLYKKLQPLTVGHAFLLEAMESPFLIGGKIEFSDLVAAVLVCSMPFHEARAFLMRPPSFIMKKSSSWGFWCRLRGLKPEAEMSKFRGYIEAYTEMPEMWKEKDKGKESSIPFAIRLAWALMSKMPEDQAWSCPMSRALAYYSAEAEHNGAEFVTEKQSKIIEADNG